MTVALLVVSVMPVVFAAGIGTGLGGDIGVEEMVPIVWQCGDRVLSDDEQQPWRVTDLDAELFERSSNYIFEGERYEVDVVVFDKNKIDTVDVELVLEQYGDDITINCVEESNDSLYDCNARIDEEQITEWDSDTMQSYQCSITILDSEHMQGDAWMTVRACDNEAQGGECGEYDEISPWFVNPIIELGVDGDLVFEDVRPGTASYSTISVENEAEGGVLLDMFITGKNWPAADTDLGRCDDGGTLVNYLPLSAFRYYAEAGAFSTRDDDQTDSSYSSVTRNRDAEGYVNINQQLNAGFEEAMFDDAEIIQAGEPAVEIGASGYGYRANVLSPGEVMGITLRLMLPEPCYGEFESQEDGSIFIWAEAI